MAQRKKNRSKVEKDTDSNNSDNWELREAPKLEAILGYYGSATMQTHLHLIEEESSMKSESAKSLNNCSEMLNVSSDIKRSFPKLELAVI